MPVGQAQRASGDRRRYASETDPAHPSPYKGANARSVSNHPDVRISTLERLNPANSRVGTSTGGSRIAFGAAHDQTSDLPKVVQEHGWEPSAAVQLGGALTSLSCSCDGGARHAYLRV